MKNQLVWIGFLMFLIIPPTINAYDNYPWINTMLFNLGSGWTESENEFAADHYDMISGNLGTSIQNIQTQNPEIILSAFSAVGYFSDYYQQRFQAYLDENPQAYTHQEIEEIYVHYECDVTYRGHFFPGCNLKSAQTGECWETPSPFCQSKGLDSSALYLNQSRAPDPWRFPEYQTNWKIPYYPSQVYRKFAVWRLHDILSTYPQGYYPDGQFWDNILSSSMISAELTREYRGQEYNNDEQHPRDADYHEFYSYVKTIFEQEQGRSFNWVGNVNNMYWIRSLPTPGAWTQWALQNLDHMSTESWVFPISTSQGEEAMPFWYADCLDMKEIWDYTVNEDITIHVDCYNYNQNGENPDMRTRIFSIVKYYLAKNPNLYYGVSEAYTWDQEHTINTHYWNPMAEVNIGMPKQNPPNVVDFEGMPNTNKFFDWNNPTEAIGCNWYEYDQANVVMARHFDNGLVIVRWKGTRCENAGPECNSYIDPRKYNLSNYYHSQYYEVKYDGLLSEEPIESINLTTNQAAVLLQVCPDGEVQSTCGCDGSILNSGEICGQTQGENGNGGNGGSPLIMKGGGSALVMKGGGNGGNGGDENNTNGTNGQYGGDDDPYTNSTLQKLIHSIGGEGAGYYSLVILGAILLSLVIWFTLMKLLHNPE